MKTADLRHVCNVAGSSHVLKTCKIGQDKFFLKFSEEDLFDNDTDPNLQVLVEFLAYRLYGLFPGVKIPGAIHLVADPDNKKVGLATQAVSGKHAGTMSSEKLGKLMSAGVFVDIFLANWDALGVNNSNVIVASTGAHRIDPGGAMTFRAQGARKGKQFNSQASELETMMDPGFGGAGTVLQYSDAKEAAKAFLSVSWAQVANRIKETYDQGKQTVVEAGLDPKGWLKEIIHITKVLKERHSVVSNHCKFVNKYGISPVMTKENNIYPAKNTDKTGDTGNLWDDGKGPEGGAKAFDKSRKEVLGALKELVSRAVRDALQEQAGTTGTSSTQPATNTQQQQQQQPEDRKAAMARAKAAQTPEAQAQAAREFHQAETQAGDEHLKKLQADRDAEMAKKDAEQKKSSQRAKPAQPVALPKQGLSQQFQDTVQKYYQQITTAPGLDQKKREQLIARLGQIQLAPEGSEQSKLGQIQSLVKGSLGSERVDFGQVAQQHAPPQQQQQFQPQQQQQGFLGKTKKLFGLNEATLKASLEID